VTAGETPVPGAPVAAAPRPGAVSRITGVFFSPVRTFADIAARPTWLAPLLLWTVVQIFLTSIIVPRMDFEKAIRARMEKSGQTVPEERMQQIVQTQKKVGGVFGYVAAVLSPGIVCLIVAGVALGAFKAFGGDLSFRQSFGVTTHGFLPTVVGSLLFVPILLRQESLDPRAIGDLLRSNLGFLVERDSSKVLHSLLQSVDIFSFWVLALLVIGFAAAARVSRKMSAGVLITLWLLYVLGKAGLTAVFS